MKTVYAPAREAGTYFVTATRPNGESFTTTSNDAPEWVCELVMHAHGDLLPDDWRYDTIREALDYIEEHGPDADLDDLATAFADDVDTRNADLLAWAGSHLSRMEYCDEVLAEGSEYTSLADVLIAAQYKERREVFDLVVEALQERAETTEEKD